MEIWETIEGHSTYSVSDKGRVRNDKTGRVLKPSLRSGYLKVSLGRDNVRYIHRLVATAFLDKPFGLNVVNHKDLDKTNNCSDNLEWCNPQMNMAHAAEGGVLVSRSKKFSVRSPEGEVHEGFNLKAFSLERGLNQSLMNQVTLGRVKSHKGWTLAGGDHV